MGQCVGCRRFGGPRKWSAAQPSHPHCTEPNARCGKWPTPSARQGRVGSAPFVREQAFRRPPILIDIGHPKAREGYGEKMPAPGMMRMWNRVRTRGLQGRRERHVVPGSIRGPRPLSAVLKGRRSAVPAPIGSTAPRARDSQSEAGRSAAASLQFQLPPLANVGLQVGVSINVRRQPH